MAATIRNFAVDRSANLSIEVSVSNTTGAVDLSLYTWEACYKTHAAAANSVSMTSNGFSNGLLTASLTGTQTANIDLGRYMYEINITHIASNTTSRVQEGILTVRGGLC